MENNDAIAEKLPASLEMCRLLNKNPTNPLKVIDDFAKEHNLFCTRFAQPGILFNPLVETVLSVFVGDKDDNYIFLKKDKVWWVLQTTVQSVTW